MGAIFDALREAIEREHSVALLTVTKAPAGVGAKALLYESGQVRGDLGSAELLDLVRQDVPSIMAKGVSRSQTYEIDGEYEVFVDVYPAPSQLVICGAVHIAIPLVKFARELGFRVVIADARGSFATRERFPDVDEIIIAYPDEAISRLNIGPASYVVVLTHDPKFDEPALEAALRTKARYVGAMGSRGTSQRRVDRLRARGLTDEQIGRIHGPIGLDIGAQNPAEIAVAIIAEIVAVKNGRAAKPAQPKAEAKVG